MTMEPERPREIAPCCLQRRQLIEALESISEGFTLYDADGVLVACNSRFRDYSGVPEMVVPGMRFEDLIRTVVYQKIIDIGDRTPEEWIAWRLAQRRNPGPPFTVCTGERKLRISERRMLLPRVPSFRLSCTSPRVAWKAGTSPKMSAVVIATAVTQLCRAPFEIGSPGQGRFASGGLRGW